MHVGIRACSRACNEPASLCAGLLDRMQWDGTQDKVQAWGCRGGNPPGRHQDVPAEPQVRRSRAGQSPDGLRDVHTEINPANCSRELPESQWPA